MLLLFDLQLQTWDEPAKTLPAEQTMTRKYLGMQTESVSSGSGPGGPCFSSWTSCSH